MGGYHDPLMLLRRIYRSVKRRVREQLHGAEAAARRVKLLEHVAAHPTDPEGHYRLAQFYYEHARTNMPELWPPPRNAVRA
jgi:hypothetical protein